MKIILNILLVLWSLQGYCNPTDSLLNCLQNDLEKENIKGKVNSITSTKKIFWEDIVNQAWMNDSVFRIEYSVREYNFDGYLTAKWYDSLKSYQRSYFIELDTTKSSIKRYYVEEIESDTSKKESLKLANEAYFYHNCTLLEAHNGDWISTYSYDTNNNATTILVTNNWGDTLGVKQVANNGKFKVVIEHYLFGELEMKETKKYNKKGELKQYIVFDGKGNCIVNNKMKYDRFGNIIKASYSSVSVEIDYEYDQHQNWTKATTSSDGAITSIETRLIEYY